MYAFLITPKNPADPDVWTRTSGDPSEYILSVYRRYSGRPALQPDGTVDPELVNLYNESSYLSVLWTFLDPMLYHSFMARETSQMFDAGNGLSWTFGTMFNSSPLGYELYWYQYFRYDGKLYIAYARTGKPLKDDGFGLSVPNLVESEKYTVGVSVDLWDQAMFGQGAGVSCSLQYRMTDHWGLGTDAYAKSRGYLLGKRMTENFSLSGSVSYRFTPSGK